MQWSPGNLLDHKFVAVVVADDNDIYLPLLSKTEKLRKFYTAGPPI